MRDSKEVGSRISLSVLLVLLFFFGGIYSVSAATKTLCSSGCDYDDLSDGLAGINNTADDLVINGSGVYWMNSTSALYNLTGTLYVNADDVGLDFNGSEMKGNTSSYGVYVNQTVNTTIFNATIRNFSRQIYSYISYNLTINQSKVYSEAIGSGSSFGIYNELSNGTNILYSLIEGRDSSSGTQLLYWKSFDGTFLNNTINQSVSKVYTFLQSNAGNMTFKGNKLYGGGLITSVGVFDAHDYTIDAYNTLDDQPIVFTKSTVGGTIENNASIPQLILSHTRNMVINNLTFNAYGFEHSSIENVTVSNIYMSTDTYSSFSVFNVTDSRFENITMVLSSNNQFRRYDNIINNIYKNVTVNILQPQTYGYAFYINSVDRLSTNNTYIDCNFNSPSSDYVGSFFNSLSMQLHLHETFIRSNFTNPVAGGLFFRAKVGADFIDSTINANSSALTFHAECDSVNLTFVNTTFNESAISYSAGADALYHVKWYLDVDVNDSVGSSLVGLNVSAYNSTGDFQFSAISTNGVARLNLTEYYSNLTHFFYAGNYTVNVTGLGYEMQSFSVNMTGNKRVNLTFECPTVTDYWWNISSDVYCSDMEIIANSNITIESSANVLFDNVTLIMNSSGDVHNKLYSYGNFTVNNSNFTAGNSSLDYIWRNEQPGRLILENSDVSEVCGNISAMWSVYNALYVRANNSIIRNNRLVFDDDNGENGLSIYRADNVTVTNNSINNGAMSSSGILMNYAINANITFNNVSHTGNVSYGLYNIYSDDSFIANNTFSTTQWPAVRMYRSNNMTYVGNEFWNDLSSRAFSLEGTSSTHFNHSIDSSNLANGYPILYYNGASNSIFQDQVLSGQLIFTQSNNVTIQNLTLTPNFAGIQFGFVTNSTVRDIVANNVAEGFYIQYSKNNDFLNISGTYTGYFMYLFYFNAGENNTITDSSFNLTTSDHQRAVLNLQSINLNFENCVIETNNSFLHFYEGSSGLTRLLNVHQINHGSSSAQYGLLYVATQSTTMELIDSSITAPNMFDINISYANVRIVMINTTLDEDDIVFSSNALASNYSIAWYLDVDVQDAHGTKIPSVNISAYDSTGAFVKSTLTGLSGVGRLNLTRYWANMSGKYYYENYTINITSAYGTESYSINMSTNRHINLTVSCPSVVDYWWNITSDMVCTNMQIIANSNISIASTTNLVLDNVTLLFNSSGTRYNRLTAYGNLTVNNSNMTALNTSVDYVMYFSMGSRLIMENTDVSECGWEDSSSGDFWGTTNSFVLNTNDSIIKNSRISGDEESIASLIVYQGYHNLVINTSIVAGANKSHTVVLLNAWYTNITNSKINQTGVGSIGYGLDVISSNYTTLINNSFYSANNYALQLRASPFGTVWSNEIISYNDTPFKLWPSTFSGIYEPETFNQSFDSRNTVNGLPVVYKPYIDNQIIRDNQSIGMLIVYSSSNITLQNITFQENASGTWLSMVTDSSISDLTGTDTIGTFFSTYESHGNQIENIGRLTNTTSGVISFEYSSNNTINNMSLIRNAGQGEYSFQLYGPSSDNIFSDCVFITFNSTYDNYFTSSVSNVMANFKTYAGLNTFYRTTFGNGPISLVLYKGTNVHLIDSTILSPLNLSMYFTGTPSELKLTNTTFDETAVSYGSTGANYSVIWYLDIGMNDTAGNFIPNANISVYNVTGQFIQSALTDSNGFARLNVTHYWSNLTHRFYQTNHTINITSAYGTESYSINMSTNRHINLTVSCPSVVDYWWNMTSDIYCQDQTLTLNSNLTISENVNVLFDNVTLILNSSSNAHNVIRSYGNLTVNNSNVTAGNTSLDYVWWNEVGSLLVLDNSDITECGFGSTTTPDYRGGIYVGGNGSIIKNSIMTFNDSEQRQIGIGINSSNDVSIENVSFTMSGNFSYSVYASNANNISLINNSHFASDAYRIGNIYLRNVNDSKIIDNNITSLGNDACLALYDSSNITIKRNLIYGNSSGGIFLSSSGDELTLKPHSIEDNYLNDLPILYYWNQSNTVIENMAPGELILHESTNLTIRNITFGEYSSGLWLHSIENSLFENIYYYNNSYYPVWMLSSNHNVFDGIIGVSKTPNSYHIEMFRSHDNYFTNISANYGSIDKSLAMLFYSFNLPSGNYTLTNSEFTGTNFLGGIFFHTGTTGYMRIENVLFNINYSTYGEIRMNSPIELSVIDSSFISNSTNSLYFSSTSSGATTMILNSSINLSAVYYSAGVIANYSEAWYLDVGMNDTAGNFIPNANISVYNVTGQFIQSALTDSNGFARLNVTHYWSNLTHRFYQTNHTINITTPYGVNSYYINMSTNRRINLTVSCPAEVPYAWNITSDIYCSDMTMRIDRNMTINESANVFFDNITLIMNSSSGAHNGIWSFGNLTVNNSNVTAGNPDDDYFWWNEQPGKLVLENSDVTEVNYDRGVYFNTYSALVIRGNGSSIKNNQIVIDSEARQYGITFLEVSGCQFENNTLISTGASAIGVWAYNSSYINLDHNTLSVTGSVGYGFYLNYAIGINFTNNTISTEEYPGFSIGDSSDVSFFGNTIVSSNSSAFWFNSQTGDVSHFNYSFDTYNVINGATIYYFEELSGTTIENIENIGEIYIANSDSIVVRNITFADNAGGLYLLNTHNSLVTELRFPKSKGYTLNQRFAQNNTFTDISVNNTGKYGISFNSKYSNNTKVMNLTLINSFRSIYNSQYGNDNIAYINSSFTSTNAACIYMTSLGEEQITNTFTNTNVSCTYSGKGIVYLDQEIELYFTDTIIHNSLGPAIEFNTPNSNNSSLHFVNATFNESGIIYDAGITANYTVAWYMDVHVNDTDGNPLYGVIVTARNRTGQIAAVGHTDQDGRARLNLTNYKSNLTDRFYQNNYTINYTFGNFNGGWSVNMSTNRDKRSSLNLTLPFIGNFSLDNRTSTFLNKTKEQLMNYSNLTLARPFGLIRWIGNTNTNGARLAQHIMMASKLIAVNTSALNNTFDSSANLEITGVDCSDYAIYRSSAFHNSAASVIAEGTECPSNICTAVSCNGTTLSFTVSGFSSYAVGPVLAEETPDTPATVTPSGSTSSGFAKNMESITFNDVKAGQEKIFILSNYLIAITKVSLKAKEFISKMKISVRSYEEAPYSLLESTIDGAYQYLKVSHENYFDNSQVEDIRFEFKVPKSWLGADKAMLYRYNDGDWNKQRTESTSTDTSYVYYTGYPEGLSYFAIAKEEAKVVPVKETPKATEPTAQTPEPILQSPQPTAQTPTGQAINPTQHTTKPTPHTQQEKSWFASNITMLVSVSVVLIGLIIAGIVFIIGHRKYPHPILQSPQPTPQDSRLGTQSPHPTPHTPESHTSQPDQKAMVNSLIRRAFEGKPVPESVQNIINATKAWAQEQSQKGHTKEQIKAALLKQGWQEDLIDRLLG